MLSLDYFIEFKLLSEKYRNKRALKVFNQSFKKEGCITLPGFFSDGIFDLLKKEADNLYKVSSKRNFTMPGYETPRVLSVVGGSRILESSALIPFIYFHYEILSALSAICGHELYTIKHKEECFVANYLDSKGHTHGWHLDDPSYALIAILEAPLRHNGGCVEYIANWKNLCADLNIDPQADVSRGVDYAFRNGLINTISLQPGDCYLLNAGKNLHRVTPISDFSSKRKVLNMAYDYREEIVFGNTADVLYAEEKCVFEETRS